MKIMCAYPIYDFYSGLGGAVGGHITHTLGISESFCTLGNEVVLAAYDQVPLLQNARFIQLYSPPRLSPKLCKLYVLLNGYKELIRVIQTEQPDVLYVRFCGLLYLDFIHRFYPHMPIISECNTPSQISMASASPSWLMRFFGKLADKGFLKASSMVIGISDHLKQLLLRLYPYYPASKVLVVPNGVDCERFSPTIAGIRQQLGIPGDVQETSHGGIALIF
jgi:glycosyltransferase involved in cell wall biosynthesis